MKSKTDFKQTEIGLIPEDWEVVKIEAVLDKIIDYRGKTPKKSTFGIKTLSARSIKNGRIDYNQTYFISEKTFKQWEKRGKPQKGDVLLTTEGPLGEVAQLNRENVAIAQRLLTLRGKDKQLDNSYLKYFLMSPIGQHTLLSKATGTTVQGIKQSEFRKILIAKPSFQEQTTIAKILSDLDSKIELNQQMNKTLEAIGQAIFKRWFIDFEFPNEKGKPYKSSGGEMVESELGEIPKGWNIKNVQNFLVFEKGVEPGSKYYITEDSEENIRFIRVGDINTPGRENTFIPINLAENKFCKEDDILLSLDATIGVVRIGMNGAFSSGVRKVYSREKGDIPKAYVYSLLKSKYIQDTIYTYAIGTTILHAGASLDHMDLAVPNKKLFQKFSRIVEPIFNLMVNNLIQNNNLEQIRDSLLPKLMYGKIRVHVEV